MMYAQRPVPRSTRLCRQLEREENGARNVIERKRTQNNNTE